jgi:hypothetical protein
MQTEQPLEELTEDELIELAEQEMKRWKEWGRLEEKRKRWEEAIEREESEAAQAKPGDPLLAKPSTTADIWAKRRRETMRRRDPQQSAQKSPAPPRTPHDVYALRRRAARR